MTESAEAILEGGQPPTFASLQPISSANHRARPPPVCFIEDDVDRTRVPLKHPGPQVQRRESKGSLRNIFTRNRVEKSEKSMVSPVMEAFAPNSEFSGKAMRAMAESSMRRSISVKKAPTVATQIAKPSATPPKTSAKPSRMNLRSKSVKYPKTTPKSPKSTKSSTKSAVKPPPRTSAAWHPPPLFQAYPQAIKHAQLSATTLSADSILRISSHKRNTSVREEFAQTKEEDGSEQGTSAKKTEKSRTKHRRQISGSISKADWTQKIYVLVTSGYLLQYSGTGSFDRLPEKMLQLGKDSVAFASDVIPGKHWVLQVSQAMDSDGTPAADSRSFLSRLTFRGADYRRTATSLLLVLDSAEGMDSWIAIIRREIEALGGKKKVSETGRPKQEDKVMQLRAQPSHRYAVQRPDQFSDSGSPQVPTFGPPPWVRAKDNELRQELEEAASQLVQPQSIRPSTGHRSVTNSIASHDGRQLESLRDSQHRLSYMSSGQRTLITSQGSSPSPSPTREAFDDVPRKHSIEDARPRPNAAAISERRRSMQTTYTPILEAPEGSVKKYRHSTYGGPARPPRSQSPVPNFSIPNPSSKQYSAMKIPVTGEAPLLPSARSQKGARKSPPTALTATRPLSPVKDSNSPKRDSYPPQQIQQVISTVELDTMSLGPITGDAVKLDSTEQTPRQASPEIAVAQLDFQFPRKFASMQLLRDDSFTYLPDAPMGKAPTTPLPAVPIQTSPKPGTDDEDEDTDPLPNLNTVLPSERKAKNRPQSVSATSPIAPTPFSCPIPQLPFPANTDTAEAPVFRAPLTILQRVKDADLKVLGNRRSMPVLVNSPPPAPPPSCALPPLPPPNSDRRMSQASRMSQSSRISQTSIKT